MSRRGGWFGGQGSPTLDVQLVRPSPPDPCPTPQPGVARLVVGGAVLALVAVRRLLARPRITPGSSGLLGAVTIFTGLPFFRGALCTLRGRSSPGTDTLVTAATVISLVLRENVVALTVLWLLNIGEFLQTLTLRRTRRAIEDLLTVGEERVWLVRDGAEVEEESGRCVLVLAGVIDAVRLPLGEVVLGGYGFVRGEQAGVERRTERLGAQPGADEDQLLALHGLRAAGARGFEPGHRTCL